MATTGTDERERREQEIRERREREMRERERLARRESQAVECELLGL